MGVEVYHLGELQLPKARYGKIRTTLYSSKTAIHRVEL